MSEVLKRPKTVQQGRSRAARPHVALMKIAQPDSKIAGGFESVARARDDAPEVYAPGAASRDVAGSRESGGIQSVERAFTILREIARSNVKLSLTEISRRVGLHNSTAFHLVRTMVSLGYIEQIPGSKRYRIGRHLFTLAAGALNEIGLLSLVTPALENLTRATSECCHFAVRSGGNSRIIARTSGTGMFQVVDSVGTLRPVHCTALGKVLMAALAPEQLEQYLRKLELRSFTPSTIVDPTALRSEIDRVRRDGIGFDDGEFDAEIRCVAVPVYDFSGRAVGALGLSGSTWRLSIPKLKEVALQVRAAGRELSAELGFDMRMSSVPGATDKSS